MNNIDEDIKRCKELIKTEHANWIGLTNQDAISNVLSELETYKKIAEKLAEQLRWLPIGDGATDFIQFKKVEEAIDWARKEVEKC